MDSFALEIKRLRTAAGLTQSQLAEKLGVTQGYIAHLENARHAGCNAETLFKLSDALGVTCDHWRAFLEAVPEEKPKPKKKGK